MKNNFLTLLLLRAHCKIRPRIRLRPRLLLAVSIALLSGLILPTRAAVTEAWVQRYNGPANRFAEAAAVAVDSIGNVVVTGSSHNGTNTDYYTAKYAVATGVLLWEQRYNGPADARDRANAVAMDGSGKVVVTGSSHNGTNSDYFTAMYAAADGALLWGKRYNGPAHSNDQAAAVALDGNGNVVVLGTSHNGTNSDYYTAKYAAADGALLWERRYNGPANGNDEPQSMALDIGGNAVVTGYSHNGTNDDYYTAKYAAKDGALLWESRYNGPANNIDQAWAVALDGNGNVIVTGGSFGSGSGYDFYTAKYAVTNGALLWEKRYNGPASNTDFAFSVAVDGDGNVVVTGISAFNWDGYGYTAKYSGADGALLWEKHSPAGGQAVAVDASGNVIVTGDIENDYPRSDLDYYTTKYAAANGMLLWAKRYSGPSIGRDSPTGLAIGPHGMVAITGSSFGTNSYDYATVVYRESLPAISIGPVSGGVRLRFPGVAAHSYAVERAFAITGPWSTNAMLIAITNGLLEYLDTNAPAGSVFYRTSVP